MQSVNVAVKEIHTKVECSLSSFSLSLSENVLKMKCNFKWCLYMLFISRFWPLTMYVKTVLMLQLSPGDSVLSHIAAVQTGERERRGIEEEGSNTENSQSPSQKHKFSTCIVIKQTRTHSREKSKYPTVSVTKRKYHNAFCVLLRNVCVYASQNVYEKCKHLECMELRPHNETLNLAAKKKKSNGKTSANFE